MSGAVPCVVLRSNDVLFTGLLRSLHAASADVVPVVFDWPGAGPWYSEHSRHFKNPVTIANPYQDPRQAVNDMVQLGRTCCDRFGERLMVLPSSDTNLMFMLDHFTELAPFFRLMGDAKFEGARHDVVDKASCSNLLTSGSVPQPLTVPFRCEADLDAVVQAMRFPCIYKPTTKDYGQSFYRAHQGKKAVQCDNASALREALRSELAQSFELVVQEHIPFEDAMDEIPFYLYADESFQIRMASIAIKEHIDPPRYGTATVLRLGWMPELLEYAQAVVTALRWRGILMIEFIRDQRDGKWKVIEVNGRPWLFVDFFRRAGLPYLQLLMEDLRGQSSSWSALRVPPPDSFTKAPVHVDLPYACRMAFGGAPPSPGDLGQWLANIPGRLSSPYLAPDDEGPGRAQIKDLATRWGLDSNALYAEIQAKLAEY